MSFHPGCRVRPTRRPNDGQTSSGVSFDLIQSPQSLRLYFTEGMPEVTVTVIFFAQARELAKLNKTTARVPETVFGHDLRSLLVDKFNLSSIGNVFILAINENYVSDSLEITLKENDIVAVIPPISGG